MSLTPSCCVATTLHFGWRSTARWQRYTARARILPIYDSWFGALGKVGDAIEAMYMINGATRLITAAVTSPHRRKRPD
mgnify:CR=1 FL=1